MYLNLLRIDQREAFLNAAVFDKPLDLAVQGNDGAALGDVEPEFFRQRSHEADYRSSAATR